MQNDTKIYYVYVYSYNNCLTGTHGPFQERRMAEQTIVGLASQLPPGYSTTLKTEEEVS